MLLSNTKVIPTLFILGFYNRNKIYCKLLKKAYEVQFPDESLCHLHFCFYGF